MHEKILKFTSRHSNSTCTTVQDMVKCLDKNIYYATVYFIGQVVSSSTVSPKQGQELAAAVGAYSYVEVSSLSNDGVEDLITEVVDAAKTYWELRCAKKKKCPACVII